MADSTDLCLFVDFWKLFVAINRLTTINNHQIGAKNGVGVRV
ncbi:hypothetical protein CFter6_2251 [Collimonas fungivorans]|uniref:Uncharacterized protein n=1 Tax=Collimonas fungivorans TaxID=158899 RepID=A0A127PB06_9BURK|nr:hypothetical protein CFter6_2251 [Collimonas fungivorans]